LGARVLRVAHGIRAHLQGSARRDGESPTIRDGAQLADNVGMVARAMADRLMSCGSSPARRLAEREGATPRRRQLRDRRRRRPTLADAVGDPTGWRPRPHASATCASR
jgi:hypothetical protein